jgi:Tol biopolymer transport system component
MIIGSRFPAEWQTTTDPQTGRTLRQFTSAVANSYPLYYFIDTITADGRTLIFHSERTGWVQLYKLDLESGEIVQLSDGRTRDAGWAIWCEHHLRGIYNHLAALNSVRGEVYYFQDEELRATQLDTLENRVVYLMPGRISIGQSSFSPDGRHYAFIHADRNHFIEAIADREALQNMGQPVNHEAWREGIPVVIGLIDTATGAYREVMTVPFHVHHVFFIDDDRLLVNHTYGENGMWIVDLDGSHSRTLRSSREGHGAVCHQVITANGLYYEANETVEGERRVWIGRYNLESDTFHEVRLPGVGYVHTGRDPEGKATFYENQQGSQGHQLLWVHEPFGGDPPRVEVLRELAPIIRGQRYHAHPFLSPDRRWLFFTEVVDGFSQIRALDVADLTT